MKEKYVVKNLFVHINRVNTLNDMCRKANSCVSFKGLYSTQYSDDRDIFNEMLSNAVEKAERWLNENSLYDTYRVRNFNKHINLWNKVYLLKDDCKINRRKIYISPINEEKYSTQREDSQIVWSELWKGVE